MKRRILIIHANHANTGKLQANTGKLQTCEEEFSTL